MLSESIQYPAKTKNTMTDKSQFLADRQLTPGDELRSILDRIESGIANLELGLQTTPVELLQNMDRAWELITAMQSNGVALIAEKAQWEHISSLLRQKASLILRKTGGSAGLKKLRTPRNPNPSQWWWFLDEFVASQSKRSLLKVLRAVLIGAAVLLLLAFIYNRWFAPDPRLIAQMDAENNATELINQQQFDAALTEVEKGLSANPENSELLIIKAYVLQKLDRPEQSAAITNTALGSFPEPARFYEARTQFYLTIGENDLALADVNQAITLDPQSAVAYLLKGQIYELQGKRIEAIDAYDIANNLATEQNLSQLIPVIRMRYGMLVQQIPMPTVDSTSTP